MAQAPSGRPPSDGWPETRGSRIGAEQERERARKRLQRSIEKRERAQERLAVGKSSKQRSIEKRNRKNRNKQQRRQRKADGAIRSKPVEQQNLPVEKRERRPGRRYPKNKATQLDRACSHYKRATIVEWLLANHYRGRRTKDPRKAAETQLAKAVGCGIMSDYWHRVLDRCIAAHPVKNAPTNVPTKPVEQPAAIDPASLEESIRQMVARAVTEAFTGLTAQQLTGKKADVDYRPRLWDDLNSHIKRASADDKKFSSRWNNLRSQVELCSDDPRPLIQRARDLGIDTTTADSWMRELCYREPESFVRELLALSREIFPIQGTASNG